jgi:biopolymer transport protein ExbD
VKFAVPRRPDPLIDITPMIDIVFQLVLFFMVSTTFISAPGFQVDLPRSSAQTVIAEKKDINVWMTCGTRLEGGACTDGPVYVDDQPVTGARLRTIFERTAGVDPSTLVVIKADQGVKHGRVVTVMDMARSEGLTRLAIATEVELDEEAP